VAGGLYAFSLPHRKPPVGTIRPGQWPLSGVVTHRVPRPQPAIHMRRRSDVQASAPPRNWPPNPKRRAGSGSCARNDSSSAIAVIGAGRVLRQQCGGLLTVAASSSRTAASCISELTLPTRCGHPVSAMVRRLRVTLRTFTPRRPRDDVGHHVGDAAPAASRACRAPNARSGKLRMLSARRPCASPTPPWSASPPASHADPALTP